MSFAWSYTVLDMFELCPKKYFHIKVAKDAKDEDSQFSGEGKDIHLALKKRVIDGVPLPLTMGGLEKVAKKFASAPGEKYAELQLALDRDFEPCTWFDKSTYVRAIIDLLIINGDHALIIDYKTGKVRPKPDQIRLSAAVLAKHRPNLKRFKLAYVWVKHNETTPYDLTEDDMSSVWADLIPRADDIEEALKTVSFPAIEGPYCKWCPVTQCPYNKQTK